MANLASIMNNCVRWWVPDKTGGYKDMMGRSTGLIAPATANEPAVGSGCNGLPTLNYVTNDYCRELITAGSDLAFTGRHAVVYLFKLNGADRYCLGGKMEDDTGNNRGCFVDIRTTELRYYLKSTAIATLNMRPTANNYHNLIVSFDGINAASNIKFWIDGVQYVIAGYPSDSSCLSCIGGYYEVGRYPMYNGVYLNGGVQCHMVYADPLNGTGHLIDDDIAEELNSTLRRRNYMPTKAPKMWFVPTGTGTAIDKTGNFTFTADTAGFPAMSSNGYNGRTVSVVDGVNFHGFEGLPVADLFRYNADYSITFIYKHDWAKVANGIFYACNTANKNLAALMAYNTYPNRTVLIYGFYDYAQVEKVIGFYKVSFDDANFPNRLLTTFTVTHRHTASATYCECYSDGIRWAYNTIGPGGPSSTSAVTYVGEFEGGSNSIQGSLGDLIVHDYCLSATEIMSLHKELRRSL